MGSVIFTVASHYKDYEVFVNSAEGKEEMYGRSGFTQHLYSINHIMADPIPMISHVSTGELMEKCSDDSLKISEFNSLSEEINLYDSKISPLLRNIKWWIET